MSLLDDFIKADIASPITIGVIGDAMVDEYFNVQIKKISPEFPIPVMHSNTDESDKYPGGAANVAYQFKHFNVQPNLISFLDKEAEAVFKSYGLNTDHCLEIENKIPRKRRFYSGDYPTYRWDVEQKNYGLDHAIKNQKCMTLFENLISEVKKFDALIFSDYDKGVLSNYLNYLISAVKVSVVDPKSGDMERWHKCTVFKPNEKEALEISGCSNVTQAGWSLINKLKCKAVVITKAERGVSVFESNYKQHEIKPSKKLSVAKSVIGGGDVSSAFLAMALARGMSVVEAAELAWEAGTIYVQNIHNKPIRPIDLIKNKVVNSPEILSNRDFKLVMANGCFDIFHSGHLKTLEFAKSKGDKLVVAVNTDESVASIKPGRPIVSLEERIQLLAGLQCVDYVVSFNESTPLELIQKIKPDVLVKGAEYKVEDIVGNNLVKEVLTAPMVEGLSTTSLIEKISHLQL